MKKPHDPWTAEDLKAVGTEQFNAAYDRIQEIMNGDNKLWLNHLEKGPCSVCGAECILPWTICVDCSEKGLTEPVKEP